MGGEGIGLLWRLLYLWRRLRRWVVFGIYLRIGIVWHVVCDLWHCQRICYLWSWRRLRMIGCGIVI
jgi:hypothetical protein